MFVLFLCAIDLFYLLALLKLAFQLGKINSALDYFHLRTRELDCHSARELDSRSYLARFLVDGRPQSRKEGDIEIELAYDADWRVRSPARAAPTK